MSFLSAVNKWAEAAEIHAETAKNRAKVLRMQAELRLAEAEYGCEERLRTIQEGGPAAYKLKYKYSVKKDPFWVEV